MRLAGEAQAPSRRPARFWCGRSHRCRVGGGGAGLLSVSVVALLHPAVVSLCSLGIPLRWHSLLLLDVTEGCRSSWQLSLAPTGAVDAAVKPGCPAERTRGIPAGTTRWCKRSAGGVHRVLTHRERIPHELPVHELVADHACHRTERRGWYQPQPEPSSDQVRISARTP